jgi:hypothetical protein
MPTVLQFRRGTDTQNNSFTGAAGELTIDATNNSIRVHNGSNQGGFETVAREAKYADIAERYHADAIYEPGTVVVFGGEFEITQTSTVADSRVAGIISTDPYLIMNSPHDQADKTNEYHPPLALAGRVPCKVTGTVKKGDLMVSSDTPGYAMAWKNDNYPPAGSVIGKSLENFNGDAGVIEVVAGRL